eukprot:752233-Hanusia_phi.AAC.1
MEWRPCSSHVGGVMSRVGWGYVKSGVGLFQEWGGGAHTTRVAGRPPPGHCNLARWMVQVEEGEAQGDMKEKEEKRHASKLELDEGVECAAASEQIEMKI